MSIWDEMFDDYGSGEDSPPPVLRQDADSMPVSGRGGRHASFDFSRPAVEVPEASGAGQGPFLPGRQAASAGSPFVYPESVRQRAPQHDGALQAGPASSSPAVYPDASRQAENAEKGLSGQDAGSSHEMDMGS